MRPSHWGHQHRIEYLIGQQPLPGGIESVVADQRGGKRGGNLRQRQRPHGQSCLTRVAKGATGYGGGDSLSQDQGNNQTRNQPETVQDRLPYGDRDNQEARDDEENWNEKSLPEEYQLFLRRVAGGRGIDRSSGQEGTDDVRQVDEIREHASRHHDAKHGDKVARLVIPQLVQDPGAGAADPYHYQRHEDCHFNDLHSKAGWRKTGRVG